MLELRTSTSSFRRPSVPPTASSERLKFWPWLQQTSSCACGQNLLVGPDQAFEHPPLGVLSDEQEQRRTRPCRQVDAALEWQFLAGCRLTACAQRCYFQFSL